MSWGWSLPWGVEDAVRVQGLRVGGRGWFWSSEMNTRGPHAYLATEVIESRNTQLPPSSYLGARLTYPDCGFCD